MPRIVEAFVGEYASGKSENAINRAVELARRGEKVTLVDLDTVEPFYTLRPLKEMLEAMNVDVVGWNKSDAYGLGEAGSVIKAETRWVLRRPGHVIMDIGYGVHGARTLNLVEGADRSPELKVLAVINTKRPMTSEIDEIIEYVRSLGRVDALVNSTHLADETTVEMVWEGLLKVKAAARVLGLPVEYTAVDESLRNHFFRPEWQTEPIRFIKRYMPAALW